MDTNFVIRFGWEIDRMVQAMDANTFNRIKFEGLRHNIAYQKLNYSQKMLMSACATREMTMSKCAKLLGINSRSISRPVDRLEKMGYLKRETCPTDKKVTLVKTTKLGDEIIAENSVFGVSLTSTIYELKWSKEEANKALSMLIQLRELFEKLDYSPDNKSEQQLISKQYYDNLSSLKQSITIVPSATIAQVIDNPDPYLK